MNFIRISLALLTAALFAPAQSPKPSFEVASVKPNPELGPPGDQPVNADPSPGHFAMRDKPLRFYIEWAYDLKDYQIVGPEWIKIDERYDISASASGAATNDRMRQMLQTLLAERLQMKSHMEKRDLNVYALGAGKGEAKIVKADPDSKPMIDGRGSPVQFHNFPLSRLTFLLTRRMDRPTLDLTGLEGNFDYKVDLSGLGNKPGSSGYDGEGKSVFQSIQEDMGLKLEPRKWPVDVLVIDSVNKVPTEN